MWAACVNALVQERGMAALLVLNKADLVPAAAAQQWMQWFEERYPGLKVRPRRAQSGFG